MPDGWPVCSLSAFFRRAPSILEIAQLKDEFHQLQTIPGLGTILAMTILIEAGRIERFAGVGNFISYCRLARSEWLSNGKAKGSGNRRNGNPYLSWAVSEAAEFARRFHPPAQRYFDRKRSQKHVVVARRALANKIARIAYYMMRDQVPFDRTELSFDFEPQREPVPSLAASLSR